MSSQSGAGSQTKDVEATASGSASHETRVDGRRDAAGPLSGLDANQRMVYLREALADEQWRQQERAHITGSRSVWQSFRRSWLRLYLPRLHSARKVIGPDPTAASLASGAMSNETFRKFAKTVLALGVALFVGWGPMQRLLQTSSVEAIVNARLITLRSPIDGEVVADPASLAIGAAAAPGASLMKIVNKRADRARLDDLRRSISQLQDESTILKMRLKNAQDMQAELEQQTRQFQQGRIQQLEARMSELKSDLLAAQARRDEAAAGLKRTTDLEARGSQTRITLEKATSDNEVAIQSIAAIQQRIKGVDVELAAAKSGYFLGDSYNDRPRSSQRADELQQKVSELNADLRQREIRLASLNAELKDETTRYADMAEARIVAPSTGKVWEVLTAPGEEVRRGQDLARMLDCNSAVVTATVAESVYNRLRVGQPAKFRFREGGPELEGRVVHLTGVAAAPSNLAIAPSALTRESYRVTVSVPKLAQQGSCDLGRTGRVIFGSSEPAARGT
jgi:multidrug resistance efflux pump